MKKLPTIIVNIGLACVSLLTFVLLIEFGLRITGLQTVAPNPPQIYQNHNNPNISYVLKPNLTNEPAYKATVSTNRLGMRSDNIGVRPITAIIGDSITFGYGVHDNETLSAKLQERIPETQWLNMAVPGYQLQQQAALYEEVMFPLQPSAAMVVFYWNDLDGLKPGKLDANGILRAHDWQPSNDSRSWLERHSAFYIAFQKILSLRQSKVHREQERDAPQKDPVKKANLENYAKDLKLFARTLPTQRYFVIWPDNFFHTETRPILIKAARDAGFTVIDLYDLFGNNVETLGWDTVHPSAKALEKAAEFIKQKLQ